MMDPLTAFICFCLSVVTVSIVALAFVELKRSKEVYDRIVGWLESGEDDE